MAQREAIVKEIIETERSYVRSLEALNRLYIEPLHASSRSAQPLIQPHDLRGISQGLSVILNLNKTFLQQLDAHKEALDKGGKPPSSLGNIFLSMAPFLKVYVQYVNDHDKFISIVYRLTEESPAFRNFLQNAERKAKEDRLQEMMPYMIMPVQRIPRYSLLLQALLKTTDESHSEHEGIKNALEHMCSVAEYIDEKLSIIEGRRKIMQIKGIEAFIHPRCFYISDGDLFKGKDLWRVFLLSDVLLCCKHIYPPGQKLPNKDKVGPLYKLHKAIHLNEVPIPWIFDHKEPIAVSGILETKEDIAAAVAAVSSGNAAADALSFHLVTKDKLYSFRAKDEESRTAWIKAINDVLQQLTNANTSIKNQPRAAFHFKKKGLFNWLRRRSSLASSQSNAEEFDRTSLGLVSKQDEATDTTAVAVESESSGEQSTSIVNDAEQQ